ncbi:protein FAR-RED IMPAIRED RESPONSE 1-like isoform X2 [Prosopis cineraria]|uniref:protein FAR-RED IMPAIRED RESPONSE 1-like isoform X2 n=1 Tax=Prosopis cineraria TaxID=364024 RepID=UPI002410067B|nr:protein FAR-RED IMPAIRED RESPONSE 1-like isoform X2 [Prosopis cineraria]
MGIDLEQPSGECHEEDNRNLVLADAVDGINNINEPRSSLEVVGNDNENAGPGTNAELLNHGKEGCTGQGTNLNSSKIPEPHDGMEFNSKEEAFSYYKDYAKSVGFTAIIKASRRSRISGKFIDAKFACSRYGNKQEPCAAETSNSLSKTDTIPSIPVKRKRGRVNLSWAKTDCKACVHVKRRQDDIWIICSFIKEHNHEIFPDQAFYFAGHGNLALSSNGDALQVTRARTKNLCVMPRKSDGYKKVDNKKGSSGNHSGNRQQLALDEADVHALLDHFMCMQDENPNFFYAVDLSEELQLRSVFWVDAKSRLDYRHFGDVILLDTTHIKNEYKLPVIPFIGVNHHYQFLLLGCAIVSDESKSTYTWVLQAWLRAMDGCSPKVILTDQAKALKEAVTEVLPGVHHCFCLWHILSKIPEKLSHVTRQHANFMTKFNKCVLKSWTNEQFEKRWWKMIRRFNLSDENWLCSIYEDRQYWIPTYMGDTFLAGMSTRKRSEAINCLLDKHVQRKTKLKEFLEQYQVILRGKCEDEAKADLETFHKQPVLKSPSPFEKQMVTLYTRTIFKKFQSEVLGVIACHPKKESENGPIKMFRVQDFEDNQQFIVLRNNITSDTSCSCRLFEFNGFLCRHVMIVLQISGVHNIPSQYILKRWTKEAKNRQITRELSDVGDSRRKRYTNLCQLAFELGDEGSLSQASYTVAVNALEEALRKCESMINSTKSIIEPSLPILRSNHVTISNSACNMNEKDNSLKKRQELLEPKIIAIGIDSSWQQMANSTRAAGLDCSYESQQSIQEMDQLTSRSHNLDGYYATQHTVSGMGQLNSVAANRTDYYSNHNIQGLGQLNSITHIHDGRYLTPQGMAELPFRQQTNPNCFDVQDGLRNVEQSSEGSSHVLEIGAKQLNSRHLLQ